MSASNYAELQILDWLGANGAPAAVTNVYVQLHTGDPGEDCTANVATESDRVEGSFGAAAAGSIANDAEILWETVAGTEEYTHFSIWDASTAGNPLANGTISPSKSVTAGEDARFAVGALTLTLD